MPKDRWLSDLIGTTRSYFRIGTLGVRLKDVSGTLMVRNAGDTADVLLQASVIKLTTSPGTGKILTSDSQGQGGWQTNPAIASAAAAAAAAADALQSSLFATSPQFRTLVGGGFAYPTHDAGANLGMYGDMSGLNAEAELTFSIDAGVYQPQSFHALAPTGGIVTIKIDGVSLSATIDSYQAGINSAAQAIFSNVTLTAGQHVLNMKITGKNASSTAYHYWLSFFVLRLT